MSGPIARVGPDRGSRYIDPLLMRMQEVVQHLPGVSARNLHRIMRNVRSLSALATMSEAALAAVMEAKPARELHQFLHRDSRA